MVKKDRAKTQTQEQDDPFVPMMAYPRQSQKEFLEGLKKKTRIPMAVLVREALDLLREKYEPTPSE